MGSLLSPVIATLYMEALEEKTLHSFPLQPTMWLRYTDDIFVVWSHGMEVLGDFHNHHKHTGSGNTIHHQLRVEDLFP